MADPLLRFSAKAREKNVVLLVEGRAVDGAWRPLLTIAPQARVFRDDMLMLDLFVPQVRWQRPKDIPNGIECSGNDAGVRVTTRVTLHSHDMIRVETRISSRRALRLEYMRDILRFEGFAADDAWAPLTASGEGNVIGDVAFSSAAAIVQSGDRVAALIPNLRFISSNAAAPLAATCAPGRGELSFGIVPYRIADGQSCEHADTDTIIARRPMVYSYYLYYENGVRPREGRRATAHRAWRLFAAQRGDGIAPQSAPFETYAGYAFDWAVKTRRDDAWRQFTTGRKRIACFAPSVPATPAALDEPPVAAPVPLGNDVRHCALRVAFGMALHAAHVGRKDLARAAAQVKDFALAAPVADGLFPTVYQPAGATWADGSWSYAGFSMPPNGAHLCRLANLSWTAYWLCRWHLAIEPDERIPALVTHYAQRLLGLQRHGGFFPAWIDPATGATARYLARSAETAVHIMFLTELCKMGEDSAYTSSARRAANFLIRHVIMPDRWEITETLWPPHGARRKPAGRSHVPLAIWWAAEALLRLHEATGTPRYLSWGARALDELALHQHLWDPPGVGAPCFGGFGAGASSTAWCDADQALYAKTFLDYAVRCGRGEYFHRGVAALRAACALLYCRENGDVARMYEAAQPALARAGTGCAASALRRAPLPGPAAPDIAHVAFLRAAGAAACSAELIWKEYGDVFIDTRRGQAYGINAVAGVTIEHDLAGLVATGRDALGIPRMLVARTDAGQDRAIRTSQAGTFQIVL